MGTKICNTFSSKQSNPLFNEKTKAHLHRIRQKKKQSVHYLRLGTNVGKLRPIAIVQYTVKKNMFSKMDNRLLLLYRSRK